MKWCNNKDFRQQLYKSIITSWVGKGFSIKGGLHRIIKTMVKVSIYNIFLYLYIWNQYHSSHLNLMFKTYRITNFTIMKIDIKYYKIRYIQLVDQLVLYFTEVCTFNVGTWICKINVLKGVTPKTDNLLVERS